MNILITGARSGMGYLYAKKLAKRGHIVYAGCRTEKEKEELEKKIAKEKVIMFPLVLDLDDDKTYPSFEKLDISCLILQAGIGEGGSILELNTNRLTKTFNTNVKGNYELVQRYLRYTLECNKEKKLFITSSLAAFTPVPYLYSYTSTKMALFQLAETLKLEVMYQKIPLKVSVILPGAFLTGFNELLVANKEKDEYILEERAKVMSIYQKRLFGLAERSDINIIADKVVGQVEKTNPSFIVSSPISQKIMIKLFAIIKTLIYM